MKYLTMWWKSLKNWCQFHWGMLKEWLKGKPIGLWFSGLIQLGASLVYTIMGLTYILQKSNVPSSVAGILMFMVAGLFAMLFAEEVRKYIRAKEYRGIYNMAVQASELLSRAADEIATLINENEELKARIKELEEGK